MTHVVMLVTNDVLTDTRVKKEALAVARLGLQVTVLGTTTQAERWETSLGPVRIIRAPVTFTMRDERVQRRNARRRDLLSLRPAWLARRGPAPPGSSPPRTPQPEPVPPGTGPATAQPATGPSAAGSGKAGAVARRAK